MAQSFRGGNKAMTYNLLCGFDLENKGNGVFSSKTLQIYNQVETGVFLI